MPAPFTTTRADADRFWRSTAPPCRASLPKASCFGHVKGAHSMAHQRKLGLVEAADGGTLFLDEIGDMPSEIQAKLLRFLQDRQVLPLGSTVHIPIDVKIIAATSRHDPKGQAGGLRPDLVARLGAQPLRLLPLCQRVEDLGRLDSLLSQALGSRPLAPTAFQALCLYPWPRNIRELEEGDRGGGGPGRSGADLTLESPAARGSGCPAAAQYDRGRRATRHPDEGATGRAPAPTRRKRGQRRPGDEPAMGGGLALDRKVTRSIWGGTDVLID